MDRNSFEGKPFQNPDFHGYWAEYFPRVVRNGLLGAVAISALIWAHNKLSNNPAEIEPPQDSDGSNGQAA